MMQTGVSLDRLFSRQACDSKENGCSKRSRKSSSAEGRDSGRILTEAQPEKAKWTGPAERRSIGSVTPIFS